MSDRSGHAAGPGQRAWWWARRALEAGFLLSAALNMLGRRAGFLTTHLADVVVPAMLYAHVRGLGRPQPQMALLRWIGATPTRAALVFFLSSAATEVSQRYWPRGLFGGRFDPLDIVAFAVGILVVWHFDVAGGRATSASGQAP